MKSNRRQEVIAAVAEASDPERARRPVAQLLGISQDAASGVLDLRVRRLSQSEIARRRDEADELRDIPERGHWPRPVFRNDPWALPSAVESPPILLYSAATRIHKLRHRAADEYEQTAVEVLQDLRQAAAWMFEFRP